jgi:uncharacterized RDD family membrane protein YckC
MSDSPPPPPPPPDGPPPPPPSFGAPSLEPDGVPAGMELASSGMRVLARFLDGLILVVVFGTVFAALVLGGDDDAGFAGLGSDVSVGSAYAIALLGVAVGFVWDAVCTKQFGGTPMKLAFGMKVVQRGGDDVEWEHAVKRWALPGAFALVPPIVGLDIILSLAQFVIVIVSLVFVFTKPLRTALWDQFADTLVVKSR